MKDRAKNALKRAASGLMAVLLVVCLVGTPRAKAVVSEGALLGSIFGSLLVSMGFSWAADNFDAPNFGEAIYDLIKQCDEEMDTGIQLLLDSNLAGLTAVGNGKLTFNQQWVRAANSFAEWFQGKFFASDDTSSIIASTKAGIFLADGTSLAFSSWDGKMSNEPYLKGFLIGDGHNMPAEFTLLSGSVFKSTLRDSTEYPYGFYIYTSTGKLHTSISLRTGSYCFLYKSGDSVLLGRWDGVGKYCQNVGDITDIVNVASASSLTAEKPQEIHYPVVAEDGSQVYAITVDGVTATDIEGIIQGAVDRILAGTAAIAGSVEQAGTSEEVTNPDIDSYKLSLTTIFPFCIPFDIYNMVTMFVAEPEAPHAEWTFNLPWSNQEYSVGWDLSAFDGIAQVCRSMELVLFAVGLAVITHKVIKW